MSLATSENNDGLVKMGSLFNEFVVKVHIWNGTASQFRFRCLDTEKLRMLDGEDLQRGKVLQEVCEIAIGHVLSIN